MCWTICTSSSYCSILPPILWRYIIYPGAMSENITSKYPNPRSKKNYGTKLKLGIKIFENAALCYDTIVQFFLTLNLDHYFYFSFVSYSWRHNLKELFVALKTCLPWKIMLFKYSTHYIAVTSWLFIIIMITFNYLCVYILPYFIYKQFGLNLSHSLEKSNLLIIILRWGYYPLHV